MKALPTTGELFATNQVSPEPYRCYKSLTDNNSVGMVYLPGSNIQWVLYEVNWRYVSVLST